MSEVKSKETVVVEMVNAEQYTRAEILAESGATPGSLASYLTAMRNAAKFTGATCCPIEVEEDGKKIFKVTTWDEAEALKAARVPKTKKSEPKTFEERLDAAQKRVAKVTVQLDKAKAAFEETETRTSELRVTILEAELEIAEIEIAEIALDKLQGEGDTEDGADLEAEAELQ